MLFKSDWFDLPGDVTLASNKQFPGGHTDVDITRTRNINDYPCHNSFVYDQRSVLVLISPTLATECFSLCTSVANIANEFVTTREIDIHEGERLK